MTFKNQLSLATIARFAAAMRASDALSEEVIARFSRRAAEGLDALELKGRVVQLRDALHEALLTLPDAEARHALLCELPALGELGGEAFFELWPLTAWVGAYGLETPERSLQTLGTLTSRFSAEFDVRPFLEHHRELTLETFATWRESEDVHLRRLVSEGSRPHLPWAGKVSWLEEEPETLLELITPLRDDPELYVRRSVANHLNDLSRRHGDWLVAQLSDWLEPSPPSDERLWLVRHALRTLIKRGHPGALALLGADPAPQLEIERFESSEEVTFGEHLEIEVCLTSTSEERQKIVLDFAVHHLKSDGAHKPKVFKWKTFWLEPGATITLEKRHPIRPITTRRYYAGAHYVELRLNGTSSPQRAFTLLIP